MIHCKHLHHKAASFFLNANAWALTAAEVQLQTRNNPLNSLDVCPLSVMPGENWTERSGKTWKTEENRPVLQGISFWQEVIFKLAFIIIIIIIKKGFIIQSPKICWNISEKWYLKRTFSLWLFCFPFFTVQRRLRSVSQIKFRNNQQTEALLPFLSNQRRGGWTE